MEICDIIEKYSEVFIFGDFIFVEYKLKLEIKVVMIFNMVIWFKNFLEVLYLINN